jgi:hypothetical protein
LISELIKLAASVAAILFLARLAYWLKLGGDIRITDEDHARRLAEENVFGFTPVSIAIDKAGVGALMRDAQGRHLIIRRHGAVFAGRLLDRHNETRLDQNFLTVGTGDNAFGKVTLNLGKDAQYWAAGLRRLQS